MQLTITILWKWSALCGADCAQPLTCQGLTYKKVDEESKPARVSLLVAVAAGSEAHRGLL